MTMPTSMPIPDLDSRKGEFAFRLSDGRKIIKTATLKVEGLLARKGGGFDPVFHIKGSATFSLTKSEKASMIGVLVREISPKEALVGLAEPDKIIVEVPSANDSPGINS